MLLLPPTACNREVRAVKSTLQSGVMPTATTPTRVPEILPKSTSAIVSTSNNLLVSGAAAAPPPDMASTTMEADSTARAPKKQRRSDMRGAKHADATQQPSAMINRRVPDKTHTRQPALALRGVRTGAAAPRAHPPPWASSPGRFRASPASPGDGSDAGVVWRPAGEWRKRHFLGTKTWTTCTFFRHKVLQQLKTVSLKTTVLKLTA